MPPGSFKSDDSFLRKLAIGAAGTRRAFEDLFSQGHEPIELERGSMSFKLWRKTIKRKRLRMPDILCLNCGVRFESRGKTDMKISMSHSLTDATRAWDVGLDDGDFVALVGVTSGDSPVDAVADALVQYVSVRELRTAFEGEAVTISGRKGVEEGSEIQVTWPATVETVYGVIEEVNAKTVRYRTDDGPKGRILLNRKKGKLLSLVKAGDHFAPNQILVSGVPVSTSCPCSGGATLDRYIATASSASVTDRYMAAKALRRSQSDAATATLLQLLGDQKEDIYVRVEAGAALVLRDRPEGKAFLKSLIDGAHASYRLEAVIVLGEVPTASAADLLRVTLSRGEEHPDVRAAAAWALGEIGLHENIDALVDCFGSLESEIRIEAARALAKLARKYRASVLATFPPTAEGNRPGIAWALSRAGVRINELLPTLVDEDARQWVAYMVGSQDPAAMLSEIDSLRALDAEVFFAVTVLWKIFGSWIHSLDEY